MSYAVSATRTEQGIRERAVLRLVGSIEADKRLELERLRCDLITAQDQIAALEARLQRYEGPRITAKSVMVRIAAEHGVTLATLLSQDRCKKAVLVRHHAYYEVRRQCWHLTVCQIGRLFKRDHTTIIKSLARWPEKAAKANIPVLPLERGAEA